MEKIKKCNSTGNHYMYYTYFEMLLSLKTSTKQSYKMVFKIFQSIHFITLIQCYKMFICFYKALKHTYEPMKARKLNKFSFEIRETSTRKSFWCLQLQVFISILFKCSAPILNLLKMTSNFGI